MSGNFVVDSVNISFGKLTLLENTKLVIQYGQRYGLVDKNGIGKTTLLDWIYERKLTIPPSLDMVTPNRNDLDQIKRYWTLSCHPIQDGITKINDWNDWKNWYLIRVFRKKYLMNIKH